jgi:hypothetical protein
MKVITAFFVVLVRVQYMSYCAIFSGSWVVRREDVVSITHSLLPSPSQTKSPKLGTTYVGHDAHSVLAVAAQDTILKKQRSE